MSEPENPRLFQGSEKIDDGDYVYWGEGTLGDLFAGLCAAGILANPNFTGKIDHLGRDAFKAAQRLLAERAKGESS